MKNQHFQTKRSMKLWRSVSFISKWSFFLLGTLDMQIHCEHAGFSIPAPRSFAVDDYLPEWSICCVSQTFIHCPLVPAMHANTPTLISEWFPLIPALCVFSFVLTCCKLQLKQKMTQQIWDLFETKKAGQHKAGVGLNLFF